MVVLGEDTLDVGNEVLGVGVLGTQETVAAGVDNVKKTCGVCLGCLWVYRLT